MSHSWFLYTYLPFFSSAMTVWHRASKRKKLCECSSPDRTASSSPWSYHRNSGSYSGLKEKSTGSMTCHFESRVFPVCFRGTIEREDCVAIATGSKNRCVERCWNGFAVRRSSRSRWCGLFLFLENKNQFVVKAKEEKKNERWATLRKTLTGERREYTNVCR